MSLIWEESRGINPFEAAVGDKRQYLVYIAFVDSKSDPDIRRSIEESLEKAISLIPYNIEDESRFFLCHWDVVYSVITIVVCDEVRENDSPNVVKCSFRSLDEVMSSIQPEDKWENETDQYARKVKSWIKDYLVNNSQFMSYSLVAGFYTEDRDECEIL